MPKQYFINNQNKYFLRESQDIMMDETSPSSSSIEHSSSLSTPAKPNVRKRKTDERKLLFFIEGYNFQFKGFNKNRTVRFSRCAHRSCDMILRTNRDDEFICFAAEKVIGHSNLRNSALLRTRNLRETIQERVENKLLQL